MISKSPLVIPTLHHHSPTTPNVRNLPACTFTGRCIPKSKNAAPLPTPALTGPTQRHRPLCACAGRLGPEVCSRCSASCPFHTRTMRQASSDTWGLVRRGAERAERGSGENGRSGVAVTDGAGNAWGAGGITCGSVAFLSLATVTPIWVVSRSGRVHGCRRSGRHGELSTAEGGLSGGPAVRGERSPWNSNA